MEIKDINGSYQSGLYCLRGVQYDLSDRDKKALPIEHVICPTQSHRMRENGLGLQPMLTS